MPSSSRGAVPDGCADVRATDLPSTGPAHSRACLGKHVTNECPEFSTHRKKNKDILLSTVQGNDQLEMEDLLLKLYFSPPVGIAPKKNVTIVDTIKSFISGIWIHPRAICQGDKNSSI